MAAETFAARSTADTIELMQRQPLAWIVSVNSGEPHATLLPILPVIENQKINALTGHFARSNPHLQTLKNNTTRANSVPWSSRIYFPVVAVRSYSGSHLELRQCSN